MVIFGLNFYLSVPPVIKNPCGNYEKVKEEIIEGCKNREDFYFHDSKENLKLDIIENKLFITKETCAIEVDCNKDSNSIWSIGDTPKKIGQIIGRVEILRYIFGRNSVTSRTFEYPEDLEVGPNGFQWVQRY